MYPYSSQPSNQLKSKPIYIPAAANVTFWPLLKAKYVSRIIKKDNPPMTDEQLAYGLQKLNEYGIIVSEAAKTQDIGSMSEQQWRSLFESIVNIGLYQPNVNFQILIPIQNQT